MTGAQNAPIQVGTPLAGAQLVRFTSASDHRGSLCAAEYPTQMPFSIRRCFWVFGVPNQGVRGEHAHRRCHQLLICVHGTCAVDVDNGSEKGKAVLDSPNLGLYLPPMIWASQHDFSHDATLLVLASDLYDPGDYIREYSQFVQAVRT